MRILLICQYAGSPTLGMAYRPHWLAKEWLAAGHEVLVVAGDKSHLRSGTLHTGTATVEGVPFLTLRTSPYEQNGAKRFVNILSFRTQLLRKCRALASWKPDVVIASSTHPMDIRPAVKIARRADALFVHQVHDLWPLTPMLLGGMSPRHPIIAWMQREEDFGCRNSDLTVSLLPATREYLKQRGLRSQRWFHVPNGVPEAADTEPAPCDHVDAIASLRDAYPLTIVYAGGHTVNDNLRALLRCADTCREAGVGIVLIGDGQDKSALVSEFGHHTNVLFLPPVRRSQVPDLLRLADAGYIAVLPSPLYKHGVSPNKIYDYLAAGLPIIENLGPAGSMVERFDCGVASDPTHEEQLLGAIRLMARQAPLQRERWGANGRTAVFRNFTQERLASQFLEALRCRRNGSPLPEPSTLDLRDQIQAAPAPPLGQEPGSTASAASSSQLGARTRPDWAGP